MSGPGLAVPSAPERELPMAVSYLLLVTGKGGGLTDT